MFKRIKDWLQVCWTNLCLPDPSFESGTLAGEKASESLIKEEPVKEKVAKKKAANKRTSKKKMAKE